MVSFGFENGPQVVRVRFIFRLKALIEGIDIGFILFQICLPM